MNFTMMVQIAMLLLQRKDEVGRVIDLVKDVGNIAAGSTTQSQATKTATGHAIGSMNWLQESLNKLTNAGLDIDGDYGPATNKAVCAYQKSKGIVVDGWAGPETVAAIIQDLEKRAS